MAEFTVGDHVYVTTRRLPVIPDQNNITRKLAPAVGGLMEAIGADAPKAGSKDFAKSGIAQLLTNLGPLTKAIASIPDADSDYVIMTCLGVVARRTTKNAAPAPLLAPGGRMMFEDIDLLQVYQIVWNVLQENMASFFSSIGQIMSRSAPAEAE